MTPAFEINSRVRMRLSPDIEGIVTAYCVREGQITYEVTWLHSGEIRCGWLPASAIRLPCDTDPIGF